MARLDRKYRGNNRSPGEKREGKKSKLYLLVWLDILLTLGLYAILLETHKWL